jgi:hypothetical protein
VQVDPHIVRGVMQFAVHAPPEHTSLAAQARPHIPQCARLLSVLTHCPAQIVWPEGHRQLPSTQVALMGHRIAHPPQFAMSLAVSMHRPPQNICPEGQGTSSGGSGRSRTTSLIGASGAVMSAMTTSVRSSACGNEQASFNTNNSESEGLERRSKDSMVFRLPEAETAVPRDPSSSSHEIDGLLQRTLSRSRRSR